MTDPKLNYLKVLRDVLSKRSTTGPLIPNADKEMSQMQVSDLALDSVETLELLMAFEDAFEIQVDERSFIDCRYIKDFAELFDTSTPPV